MNLFLIKTFNDYFIGEYQSIKNYFTSPLLNQFDNLNIYIHDSIFFKIQSSSVYINSISKCVVEYCLFINCTSNLASCVYFATNGDCIISKTCCSYCYHTSSTADGQVFLIINGNTYEGKIILTTISYSSPILTTGESTICFNYFQNVVFNNNNSSNCQSLKRTSWFSFNCGNTQSHYNTIIFNIGNDYGIIGLYGGHTEISYLNFVNNSISNTGFIFTNSGTYSSNTTISSSYFKNNFGILISNGNGDFRLINCYLTENISYNGVVNTYDLFIGNFFTKLLNHFNTHLCEINNNKIEILKKKISSNLFQILSIIYFL